MDNSQLSETTRSCISEKSDCFDIIIEYLYKHLRFYISFYKKRYGKVSLFSLITSNYHLS